MFYDQRAGLAFNAAPLVASMICISGLKNEPVHEISNNVPH